MVMRYLCAIRLSTLVEKDITRKGSALDELTRAASGAMYQGANDGIDHFCRRNFF